MTAPTLQFGPASSPVGFTSVRLAAHQQTNPPTVVRELVQNSSDAARHADRDKTRILFILNEIKLSDIPEIRTYRKAFRKAEKFQEEHSSGNANAEQTIRTIEQTLQKEKVPILTVIDNGIGLDQKRMDALLSDGISVKSTGATGTYGNGHTVSIPTSDLRYVLYAGLDANGQTIGAGHAVLASHNGSKHLCSQDGYLVKGLPTGQGINLYNFAQNHELPKLIQDALNHIKTHSLQGGAAVIIPAFNHFRINRKKNVGEEIILATAKNFFPSIHRGNLEVSFFDQTKGSQSKGITLNQANITEILEKSFNAPGSDRHIKKAHTMNKTYTQGKEFPYDTGNGRATIYIRSENVEQTSIEVFRNGMHITNGYKFPGQQKARGVFNQRKPFQALVLIDAQQQKTQKIPDFHGLIAKAETPMHDDISIGEFSPDERKALRKCMQSIWDFLKEQSEPIELESHIDDEFFTFSDGPEANPQSRMHPRREGAPRSTPKRSSDTSSRYLAEKDETNDSKPTPKDQKPKKPLVLKHAFEVASAPQGPSIQRINIHCTEDSSNVELRMSIDENIDDSYDSVRNSEITYVPIKSVTSNGNGAIQGTIMQDYKGNPTTLALGDLKQGQSININVEYEMPTSVSRHTIHPNMRVEIYKAPAETKEKQP